MERDTQGGVWLHACVISGGKEHSREGRSGDTSGVSVRACACACVRVRVRVCVCFIVSLADLKMEASHHLL